MSSVLKPRRNLIVNSAVAALAATCPSFYWLGLSKKKERAAETRAILRQEIEALSKVGQQNLKRLIFVNKRGEEITSLNLHKKLSHLSELNCGEIEASLFFEAAVRFVYLSFLASESYKEGFRSVETNNLMPHMEKIAPGNAMLAVPIATYMGLVTDAERQRFCHQISDQINGNEDLSNLIANSRILKRSNDALYIEVDSDLPAPVFKSNFKLNKFPFAVNGLLTYFSQISTNWISAMSGEHDALRLKEA